MHRYDKKKSTNKKWQIDIFGQGQSVHACHCMTLENPKGIRGRSRPRETRDTVLDQECGSGSGI